jgi:hypothetical protein
MKPDLLDLAVTVLLAKQADVLPPGAEVVNKALGTVGDVGKTLADTAKGIDWKGKVLPYGALAAGGGIAALAIPALLRKIWYGGAGGGQHGMGFSLGPEVELSPLEEQIARIGAQRRHFSNLLQAVRGAYEPSGDPWRYQ